MMDAGQLARELRLTDEVARRLDEWNYGILPTVQQEHGREALTVLEPGHCEHWLSRWARGGEALRALAPLLEQVRGSEALRTWLLLQDALLLHDLLSSGAPKPPSGMLTPLLGTEGDALFDLLCAISAVPQWFATYRRLGVPDEYAWASVPAIYGNAETFFRAHGHWGHSRDMHWLAHYIEGKLFRIGRFEYMVREAAPWVPAVFRSRRTGRMVLLARDNWKFLANGLRLPLDEPFAKAEYTTSLVQDGKVIRGTLIDPRGFARLEREVTLDATEYEAAMKPYELTAEIHIPGGGGMTMEKVQASLKEAREFFPKHLGWKPPFFWCVSWVFNPDIAAELPASNIAELQRRVYLAPRDSTRDSGLHFVFGRTDGDWLSYPDDTSLRRAFLNILRRGGILKNGVMVIDDAGIDAFRPGFYADVEL